MSMRVSNLNPVQSQAQESPTYVRVSLAAAMTLGFVNGWFYRNARLGCVNLLLTYTDGCRANCAFCGLAREKPEAWADRKFIRVPWKTYPADEVIEGLKQGPSHVKRVCISMITHPRAQADTLTLCREIAQQTGLAVSLLISPTLLGYGDLLAMKDAGADRVGIAVDAATPALFESLRGRAAKGPHKWDKYWDIYGKSLEIFGQGKAGVHLICGLGESETEMTQAISRARAMGGCTHLFSFFPETGARMQDHVPPAMGTYRRIQLARRLIDGDLTRFERMSFDASGRIIDFGVSADVLERAIASGQPFETSGCPGPDGRVACNRPYGNEKPGPEIRNFPFPPEREDIERIRRELTE
jgi:biotin synthase